MYLYSVMPPDAAHVEEYCADIVRQRDEGIADTPLLMFELIPEGRPLFDKAQELCRILDMYTERLAPHDIRPAVLVQSSLGHVYPLDEPADMQRIVTPQDGSEISAYCPLDENFRQYFYRVMQRIAQSHPSAVMLDDDVRLIARPVYGCMCDRHLALFNERAGTQHTRESLYAYLTAHSKMDALVQLYETVETDTLVDCVAVMRAGLDSVDPTIQGICCVNARCQETDRTAPVFAGKGNPVIVRAANGTYAPPDVLNFSDTMRRSATIRQKFGGIADVIIAETDAIPYNRYGKSARYLHAHFTGTLLDGMQGAKHWITRLNEFALPSGEAYRKILGENAKLYQKITTFAKDLRWCGCRVPLPQNNPRQCGDGHFAACVLERMGIPLYFSAQSGGAVFANGDLTQWFTEAEFSALTADHLFLSSDAALSFIRKGYGDELGVCVQPWDGANISGERFADGDSAGVQVQTMQLVPTSPDTQVDSVCYHRFGSETQPLFPGVTVYEKGGKLRVVFCGTPKAQHNYLEAFSFLNAARKRQLVRLLARTGCLPVYYPQDAQALLRAAKLPDGRLLILFLNTGTDPLDSVPLVFAEQPAQITRLRPDGTEEKVAFCQSGGETALDCRSEMMDPLLLIAAY